MEKRYGLPTAICMVVGIVIGSGVFFKAEKVLQATQGNMPLGILAWGIVGAIMIICSYVFATMATRYEKVSGLVDYAEATVGRRYAYYVGWFMAVLYTPCLVSALAWISARYFCVLLGWDITGGACMTIAGAMLCLDHVLNALAPRLAGKFQVSTTVIKMIPLALMAVCGAAAGLMNGRMAENFATMSAGAISTGEGLMASTVAVAFAYEGWILATSINAELRDAKRTLPRALVVGAFIVVATYILYYVGLTGAVTTEELMASGEAAAKMAFQRVFGETAGTVVFVADRHLLPGHAERPDPLLLPGTVCPGGPERGTGAGAVPAGGSGDQHGGQLRPGQPGPVRTVAGVFLWRQRGRSLVRPLQLRLLGTAHHHAVRHVRAHVHSIHAQEHGPASLRRFVMPALALCACAFMVYAAFAGYGVTVLYYLGVYAVVMGIGWLFDRQKK